MLPENYTGYAVHTASEFFEESFPWYAFIVNGDIVDRADDGQGRWTGEPEGLVGCYLPVDVPDIGRSPKDTRSADPEPGYYVRQGRTYHVSQKTCRLHTTSGWGLSHWAGERFVSSRGTRRLGEDPPDGVDRCPLDPLFTEPEAEASEPAPTPEPQEATPPMSDPTPSTSVVECTYDTLPLGACFQYVNGDPDTVYQKVHLSVGTGGMDDAQRKRAVLVSCKPGGRWPIGTVFPSTNTDTRRVVPVLGHLQVWR